MTAGLGPLLACPRCQLPLGLPRAGEPIVCTCGGTYSWDEGVPDMTPLPPPPGLVGDRWSLWEQLQANGSSAYEADPEGNLSLGERVDARLFGAFAALTGTVLDVGCGPQVHPSYVPPGAAGVELVGIDPLRGARLRSFAFVRGLGEYLPFRDGCFDRVLFATTLDHMLDPQRTLREARRVLRPGGRVVVWHGITGDPPVVTRLRRRLVALTPRGRREAAARPATPDGAVDAYHVAHPTVDEIEGWVAASGLRVVERAILSYPSPGLFLSAERD